MRPVFSEQTYKSIIDGRLIAFDRVVFSCNPAAIPVFERFLSASVVFPAVREILLNTYKVNVVYMENFRRLVGG